MKRIARYAGAAAGGGAIALAATRLMPEAQPWRAPSFSFPPDAGLLFYQAGADGDILTGALTGMLLLLVTAPRHEAVRPAAFALTLFNPAALFALVSGADAAFFFGSILFFFSAAARLAADRDHVAAGGFGLAIAAAPMISSGVLLFYPLLLASGLLSPWGYSPRKLAGFYFVILTPLALFILALVYLYWLFGLSPAGLPANWRSLFEPEAAVLAAGALSIAVAASANRRIAALAAAFAVSGFALFQMWPSLVPGVQATAAPVAQRPATPHRRTSQRMLRNTDMAALAGTPFWKMNGLGNDFVIVDLRGSAAKLASAAAAAIADRKDGIGCDQVITLEDEGGLFMGVWNADGSEVGACGNAARCVAWRLMEESGADEIEFATASATMKARRAGDKRVTVDMGEPRFGWRDIPLAEQMDDTRFIDVKLGPIDNPVLWGPSAVNMGNPHCIFFVDDADAQALDRFGPMIENHPLFPQRTNVGVAQVKGKQLIRLRVWERGAGITKACGTGACAALVAANRRRLTDRRATVQLDGGPLAIEWDDDNHVKMTGPVAFEFDGVLPEGL